MLPEIEDREQHFKISIMIETPVSICFVIP